MSRKLARGSFVFAIQRGILIPKASGKGYRPVVLAPVENRIVQRAILEVLQDEPTIKTILNIPTSYGGIKGRDRAQAIAATLRAIHGGAAYHIRSDIEGFFTEIPRRQVADYFAGQIHDDQLINLFYEATTTEIDNLEELGNYADYFPLDERGVAQGNPLSPLMGNVLLYDFDRALNNDGIVCLRYIDDFLLLGPNERAVREAFRRGQEILRRYGMKAYDPRTRADKASSGATAKGLDFLGCFINPGFVEPGKAARKKLIERVDRLLTDGQSAMKLASKYKGGDLPKLRYVQTLEMINRVLTGWGHAVSFCTKRDSFEMLDRRIDDMLDRFRRCAGKLTAGKDINVRRRVLGVRLLTDTPRDRLSTN